MGAPYIYDISHLRVNAMDRTNDDSCSMAVKRMGMLGVSVRKMKAPTVKMEAVTLISNGR